MRIEGSGLRFKFATYGQVKVQVKVQVQVELVKVQVRVEAKVTVERLRFRFLCIKFINGHVQILDLS